MTDVVTDNDTDNGSDRWVTVSEAADLLGFSERTIWRRISAQRLEVDRSVTPHLVRVCDTVSDRGSDIGVTKTVTVSELSELEAELEGVRADLRERGRVVEDLQAEVEELEGAVESLEQVAGERLVQVEEAAAELGEREREVEDLQWEVKRLEELLAEVRSERDYLRRAHATELTTMPQRLLEVFEDVEGERSESEREGFGDWFRRVFPWLGGDR